MKKILIPTLLSIGIIGFMGVSIASAHGWGGGFFNLDPEEMAERQSQMFENKAGLLGVDVEEVKNYWAEGKNVREIIEELGIDEDEFQGRLREARQVRMESRLQALVDNEVITQEQADRRLQTMEERSEGFENGELKKNFGGDCRGGFSLSPRRGGLGW